MFGAPKRKAEDDARGGKVTNRRAAFARSLEALNTQFAAWVAEQARSAGHELWTDGVEDYVRHAQSLLSDYSDVLEAEETAGGRPGSSPAAAAPAPPAAGGFGFGGGAAAGGAAKPPLAPGGLFGASGGGGPAAAPASIFGALPSGGGFGGGFGSGSTPGSAANSGGSGLFTVPSTGTLGSSFATGGGGGGEGEEDEGEEAAVPEEPSVTVEAGEGTELLAKQRVKLMSMNEAKKWGDKGHGTLTLRRATAEGASRTPYFVFTTDSGRVLINAPLLKGMKPTANPRAPASVIMFLVSSVEGKEERSMHMFRCDSPDVAKQLMATISEHVPA